MIALWIGLAALLAYALFGILASSARASSSPIESSGTGATPADTLASSLEQGSVNIADTLKQLFSLTPEPVSPAISTALQVPMSQPIAFSGSGSSATSSSGTRLNAAAIAGYARDAGFYGDDLVTAVAVALAESGGFTGAVGDNGTSFGLWQIHLPAHPEFQGQDLTDPRVNAQAAFSVYQAREYTFAPWSTYNSGAYVAFVPQASAAVSV